MTADLTSDLNWFAVLEHPRVSDARERALFLGGVEITYADMLARSSALAAGLHARGVHAGDVVGLLAYDRPSSSRSCSPPTDCGAVLMPINWRLAAPEVRYILEHSAAKVLVADETLVGLAGAATSGLAALVRVAMGEANLEGWVPLADLRAARNRLLVGASGATTSTA